MSEIQTHIGKLVRIYVPQTLEKFEKWMEEHKNIDLSTKSVHDNYIIYYNHDYIPKFIFFNINFTFEIIDQTFGDDVGNIDYFKCINHDQYDYVFQYHNGGTCFSEMLEEHLENLNLNV